MSASSRSGPHLRCSLLISFVYIISAFLTAKGLVVVGCWSTISNLHTCLLLYLVIDMNCHSTLSSSNCECLEDSLRIACFLLEQFA